MHCEFRCQTADLSHSQLIPGRCAVFLRYWVRSWLQFNLIKMDSIKRGVSCQQRSFSSAILFVQKHDTWEIFNCLMKVPDCFILTCLQIQVSLPHGVVTMDFYLGRTAFHQITPHACFAELHCCLINIKFMNFGVWKRVKRS